jgi:hypothetical protein
MCLLPDAHVGGAVPRIVQRIGRRGANLTR